MFHSTDCANYWREFKGWTKEERDPYVAQLLPVMPSHKLAGVVIGIHLPELQKAFNGHPELIDMFGTPYTACFQWAISIIMEIATEHGKGERMAFVHDDYKGECLKAFEYVSTYLNPRKIPMTVGFGSKTVYPPLQAADVLAYEGGKFLKNPTGTPRRAWTAIDPDKSRIIARRYGPDNMPELLRLLTGFRENFLRPGGMGRLNDNLPKRPRCAVSGETTEASVLVSNVTVNGIADDPDNPGAENTSAVCPHKSHGTAQ